MFSENTEKQILSTPLSLLKDILHKITTILQKINSCPVNEIIFAGKVRFRSVLYYSKWIEVWTFEITEKLTGDSSQN
jgi:hypothetical protein